ncbi:MAG: DUF2235 domain-containing protein [Alteromonadaceae bacterium]|nr:DUF2235 domain-containing protein [Alteromonadaceae bacterium]
MSKNIVIFSDATGQEGGKGHNTNIYKLFSIVENRSKEQVTFYDAGLGTGWNKITGSIGGMGISQNILECYRFIFDNYKIGDKIFLFGFSRGAATMRSLSSFIHYFGILPQSRPELIARAFKIYKIKNSDKRETKAKEFIKKHHNIWAEIQFLGCYDTVSALGLPIPSANTFFNKIKFFSHKFHDFRLSKSVKHAYHALALDDERKTFLPKIWKTDIQEGQSLTQVWFSGMHTDVGGGYEHHGLSDIPFIWMTEMAVDKGLLIYDKYDVDVKENADGVMGDSRGTRLTKLYPKEIRDWDVKKYGKPRIHQSVIDRANNPKNEYAPWILDKDYEHVVEKWTPYSEQSWKKS